MLGNIHHDLHFFLEIGLDSGSGEELNDCHGSLHLDWSLWPFGFWVEQEGRKWSNGGMGMGRAKGKEERRVE